MTRDNNLVLTRPNFPIGYGTAHLYAGKTRAHSLRLLHTALDVGITWFDTARLYGHGQAEQLLGEALVGRRHRVTLISKAGILPSRITMRHRLHAGAIAQVPILRNVLPPPVPVVPTFGVFGVDQVRTSVERSLRALRTDYLDGLLLHECGLGDATRPDLIELLHNLKREGKIRAFGTATSVSITLSLAAQPNTFGLFQFASNAWSENVDGVRVLTDAFLVTHSILGVAVKNLMNRLASDERFRMTARNLGINPDQPDIARRLLAHSIRRNPSGVSLFSSQVAEHITAIGFVQNLRPEDGRAAASLVSATLESGLQS